MTTERIILACGILFHLGLLCALGRKLFARPLQPALRGKSLVPTIGRRRGLNEALHARLSLSSAQPINRVVKAWGAKHGPALIAHAVTTAQLLFAAAFIVTWALLLVLCCADEPRIP